MKKILMLGTGGTIACKRGESGLKPLISSEELLSYVPDAKQFCQADSLQILNIDSTNMQPKHWLTMAEAIEAHYENTTALSSVTERIPWPTRPPHSPI